MAENIIFIRAFEYTIGIEGGYQCDPDDKGNWTGGEIGVGELKGTKYGISAASYPDLDIKNLTPEKAKEIYYRDWWMKLRLNGVLSPRIAAEIFDTCVNCGKVAGVRIAQESLAIVGRPVSVDGIMGPKTLKAINAYPYQNDLLIVLNGEQYVYYKQLIQENPRFQKYARGWRKRVNFSIQ